MRTAYEYEPNGLVCGFTAETTGALNEDTVTFRASVLGDTDGITYTWTLVDQDGVETVRSGGVLVTADGGIVTNCIVRNNTTVRNSLVSGNYCVNYGGGVAVAGCEVSFDHCLIGVDPKLRGKGKWAYRPVSGSPCIDAGRKQDWMTGALDVYGQPHLQRGGYDILQNVGAAERGARFVPNLAISRIAG